MICLATPARAADNDYKGWFIALDAAMTQPNSLDQHYANLRDSTTHFTARRVIDNKSDATVRGTVGYAFGKTIAGPMGRLQVEYWSFDHDDRNANTENGQVFPTLFGYTYNNYGIAYAINPPVDVLATSRVTARTVDIDYVRPMITGEKLVVEWLAGIRHATYKEDQGFSGTSGGATTLEDKHIDSKGTGLRFGAKAVFGFTKHFSLEGGMAVSLLQATSDAESSHTLTAIDRNTAADNHVRGETRDFDLRAV